MQKPIVVRCRYYSVTLGVFRFCFVIALLMTVIITLDFDVESLKVKTAMQLECEEPSPPEGFAVYTEGCHIVELELSVPILAEFSQYDTRFHTRPLDCAREYRYGPVLVESDATRLWIVQEALPYFNLSDAGELACCYRPFWRVEKPVSSQGQYSYGVDIAYEYSKTCTPFTHCDSIQEEFLKIECYVNGTIVHVDFHSFTPRKDSSRDEDGHKEKVNRKQKELGKEAFNILVFGIDSVSRANFHRRMPQTASFLEKHLGAIEIFGLNKVGENTFPNLIPVLTGLSDTELEETYMPSYSTAVFDNCPFIWNNFSDAGYLTTFAEDFTFIGLFTYLKIGFRKQPTDYYAKIFNHVSEGEIGFGNEVSSSLCMGPRKCLHTMTSHASKFYVSMKETPKFGLYWSASATHEAISYAGWVDSDLREFFEDFVNKGGTNDTVVFFISDHGFRWSGATRTHQGFLEERLPFMYVICPDRFKQRYALAYANLKINARRLVTPFDLHEALSDLLDVNALEGEALARRAEDLASQGPLPRGISLFLPVPERRTCTDAGIDDHWCACHERTDVPVDSAEVMAAANHVVDHVNSLLRDSPQCAVLALNAVLNAREERSLTQGDPVMSDSYIRDLLVTVATTPGEAVFEATVRLDGLSNSCRLLGSVSRINRYGDSSLCVLDAKLRLYCYCVQR